MRGIGHNRRLTLWTLSTLLLMTVISSGGMNTSGAAPHDPTPRAGWTPDGPVHAVTQVGDRVILAGAFTSLSKGSEVVTRHRVAALDAATGELDRTWAPAANNTVLAVAASGDGSRIFLAGTFGAVNGASRGRVAAVDATTGALVPGFNTSANSTVRALMVHGSTLYLGGAFTKVKSATRHRLAAVSTATGAPLPWAPRADNQVHTLGQSPDGRSVYVGGRFHRLNDTTRHYLGSLDADTGATTSWAPPAQCHVAGNPCHVLDLTVADRVYVAVAGPGGTAAAYDSATGKQLWRVRADGDVQAVAYAGGFVYAGGHFDPDFGGQKRSQLAAVVAATGAVDPDFAPVMYTAYPGVWDLEAGPEFLRAAGGFTDVNRTGRAGYAEFPVPTVQTELVRGGATWRYLDDYSDAGSTWPAPDFDDDTWRTGSAELGFGDDDETTLVRSGGITTYYRHAFEVEDPAALRSLALELVRDDGAAVYLNGVEVDRSNLPDGPLTHLTPASSTISGSAERAWTRTTIPSTGLREGTNVLAVEVHNASRWSSDISFDLRLTGHS